MDSRGCHAFGTRLSKCAVSARRARPSVVCQRKIALVTLLFMSILAAPVNVQSVEPADAIVVLGHRPPRDAHGIEYETRARVERGVELLRAGAASRILFSGGQSTPQWVEAEVMAEHALALGVPAAAIVKESQSRDTIENARFSVGKLRRELRRAPKILLVTSAYHAERAARLFRCAGADVSSVSVELTLPFRSRLGRRMREASVRMAYWFIDECGRAAGTIR